ncbi:MAG: hypothetical protein ACI4T6_00165 [Candidatus Flemingiibacterium sp.]
MKETYFAIIGAVPTLLIGVENYIYFFVSGKLGFLTALISKPIKSFLDPPDYICAGIVGALAIFIEFCLAAQYDGDDSYIRVTNTGTEVNLMRIVSNIVYIVCALPLILLVGYGFRWVVYIVISWFNSAGNFALSKKVFDFLGNTVIKVIFVALVDLILLKKFVFLRIDKDPFRSSRRMAVGPDGKKYNLPVSYKVGITYLLGDDAEVYAAYFSSNVHRLLWLSETADLGKKYIVNNSSWTIPIPGRMGEDVSDRFAIDASFGSNMKWSDYSEICIQAARGWHLLGDPDKSAHYYSLLADAACALGSSWPYRGDVSYAEWAEESFAELIDYYSDRKDSVKAAEYEKKRRQLHDNFSKAKARGEELISRQQGSHVGNTFASENEAEDTPVEPEQPIEKEDNTVFEFPRFIYDEDGNPWELMSSGTDNARYYCQKTDVCADFYSSDFEYGSPSGFHRR